MAQIIFIPLVPRQPPSERSLSLAQLIVMWPALMVRAVLLGMAGGMLAAGQVVPFRRRWVRTTG